MAFTPPLNSYNFTLVTAAWGPIVIDGFSEGEGITLTEGDYFGDVVGDDGRMMRFTQNDPSVSLKVSLMQGSATNDAFTAALQVMRAAQALEDVQPFTIRDNSGRSFYQIDYSWLMRGPEVTFAKSPGARVWEFRGTQLKRYDGGA